MIELRGVHGPHQRDVIRAGGDVRQQIADFHAALAVFFEDTAGAHHRGRILLQKGKLRISHDRIGQRLSVVFVEQRLGIKEIHLRGAAFEEDEDTSLRLRREMRHSRGKRISRDVRLRGQQAILPQQGSQGKRPEAAGTRRKKIATGLGDVFLR